MVPETHAAPSGAPTGPAEPVMLEGVIREPVIREDSAADTDAVAALTRDAFAPMRFADGSEADLPAALRRDGALTFALVAEDETGALVGHVAFSPVSVSDTPGAWFALGPISVRPDRQRRGIGSALVAAGLARLAQLGADGCVLTGNPAVYRGMGFVTDGALHHDGTPDSNVLWHSLTERRPRGHITFARAFGA